ncbi:uncharacterized protein LOC117900178 [Drosophila subobscura]|uniref:uncharacterized protein LOC117900178 n=1 Tax=Drosophila subobscura TaxID=7241 RepID=UPI00155B25CC|nr:uncharacterized protein LOC117900178 [Drosophila subobscura]
MQDNCLDATQQSGSAAETADFCLQQPQPTMRRTLKRPRGKNFSVSEERILHQLVDMHKDVLSNKKNDAATWKLKSDTWAKIAEEFCMHSGVVRNWEALRDKYTNTKRKERRYNGETLASVSSQSEEPNDDTDGNCLSESCYPSVNDFEESNILAPSEPQYEASYSECSQDAKKNYWVAGVALLKMQQQYHRDENARQAERHSIEMEKHRLELHNLRLKNHLLELEIEERIERR